MGGTQKAQDPLKLQTKLSVCMHTVDFAGRKTHGSDKVFKDIQNLRKVGWGEMVKNH